MDSYKAAGLYKQQERERERETGRLERDLYAGETRATDCALFELSFDFFFVSGVWRWRTGDLATATGDDPKWQVIPARLSASRQLLTCLISPANSMNCDSNS